MNRMTKVAAVAVVLAMVAFGPSMALAAPQHGATLTTGSVAKAGFFQSVLRLLGFFPNANASISAEEAIWGGSGYTVTPDEAIWGGSGKTVTPNEAIWGGSGHTPSTNEAIWGGSGKCRYGC
jgi:hypothetical protein